MATPKFKSPVIKKAISIAKSKASGGGTDRPKDWRPPEEQKVKTLTSVKKVEPVVENKSEQPKTYNKRGPKPKKGK